MRISYFQQIKNGKKEGIMGKILKVFKNFLFLIIFTKLNNSFLQAKETKEKSIESSFEISTEKGYVVYNDNYQIAGECFSLNKKKELVLTGETIFWSENLQITCKKATLHFEGNKIKKIILEKSKNNEGKPLLVIFNELNFPNHCSADFMGIEINKTTNNIEKIYMKGNVECIYFIINKGEVQAINKSNFEKLTPFYNKETNKWDIDMKTAKGEIIGINDARNGNVINLTLQGFNLYNNIVLQNAKHFEEIKKNFKKNGFFSLL